MSGPQLDDIDAYWAEHNRRAAKRTEHYRRQRRNKALRKQLLQQNPFCSRCGVNLQGVDPQAECYAHVCRGQLSCQGCVTAIFDASLVVEPSDESELTEVFALLRGDAMGDE